MIRNYYTTAIRNIGRSKAHAAIHIIGLSTGIAFFLLIAIYGWSEWRVNRGLRHADRQYILSSVWKDPNMGYPIATLGPLAKALKENYPTLVANYYRFDGIYAIVSSGDKNFRENVQIGDSTLLSMYGFPLLHGDARTALNAPFTIVITADRAIKYFGRTDVVGQDLTVENFSGGKQNFRITGVLKDPERNSVTRLTDENDNRILIPSANLSFFGRNMDWANRNIANFVELQEGVKPEALAEPIAHLIKLNANDYVSANLRVAVLPLSTYYLTGNGAAVQKMIYILFAVAIFILAMAVINFINLSVGRSAFRMKEIGIRKVLGSLRRQLMAQFLVESVLLVLLSTGIAILLYQGFAGVFSGILGREVISVAAWPAAVWIGMPVFVLLVGSVAGAYPAFVLTSLSSVDSLKGRAGAVRENIFLHKGLVVFQFAIALMALVGAIIISQQIGLFFSDRLGYNKDYIVSSQLPRDWTAKGVQRMETIRDAFLATGVVKDVTLSFEVPDGNNSGSVRVFHEGGDSTQAVVAQTLITDDRYAATYQIPLAAGSFFHTAEESERQDPFRIVLNETMTRALGWSAPQQAIGQRVKLFGWPQHAFTVSGVVKDFHFGAMGNKIDPEVFVPVNSFQIYRFLSFKLRSGNIGASMARLQHQWAALLPDAPFEYRFMDETLQAVYRDELRLKQASFCASFLAMVIVLLGVIGLLSLSIQKRTKEIAIRKVVGASVVDILRLFLRAFLPLLLVASVIISPLTWIIMQHWLDNYATRITLTPWPFVMATLSLGIVMSILIVTKTAYAAIGNPTKNLRTE